MPTRKWGVEKLVNTTTLKGQTVSKVAALSGGRFVVVWQDGSGANMTIRGQLFDPTGNKIGSEIVIGAAAGSDDVRPDVTGLTDGGFLVTWTQQVGGVSNAILGSVYDANGLFVRSEPIDVISSNQPDYSDVARGANGAAVVWETVDGVNMLDIGYRWINADGTEGPILQANSGLPGNQWQPAIAMEPGGSNLLAIVWRDDRTGTVEGRLSNGSLFQGGQFLIDTMPSPTQLSDLDVAWLNRDQFAVIWWEESLATGGIELRLFDISTNTPVAVTDVIHVNATATLQFTPTITALPSGGFVLAWEDGSKIGVDDNDSAIKLQAFDRYANKIGGEITVNTTTTDQQMEPAIAALPDGRVVVSWTDRSNPSGGDVRGDIRMQIIDPRDGIVTGTGGNETLYGNDQVNDEISGGAGDDKLYGMRGDDTLYGGEGNDVLSGGLGADIMVGGPGNDTYYVGSVDDSVIENLGEGTDTVYASVSYALDAGSSIQFLRANSGSGLTLTGNELDNTIVGGIGNDTLIGGSGNDTLQGGSGVDKLTGGTGADKFVFTATAGSTVAAPDTILDFSTAALDKIDLHQMDANASLAGDQAFSFIGTSAFSGVAGQLRYAASGANTLVSGDVNGDKTADFAILVNGAHTFSAADFVL